MIRDLNKTKIALLVSVIFTTLLCARDIWTPKQANEWYNGLPYLAGVNYVPSYAVNAIEVWSDETFDIKTIERELLLLKSINMNVIRIFLNDKVHQHNPDALYSKMQQLLDLCEKHDIYVMFTFFTNGGRPESNLGKQPEPVPGKHNSQWVKSPSLSVLGDDSKWGYLRDYVFGTVSKFADNKRVIAWNVFNEPGNVSSTHVPGQKAMSNDEHVNYLINTKKLMEKSFKWAREANPSQPITAPIWTDDPFISKMFSGAIENNCDVMSYHCYENIVKHYNIINRLKKHGRPIMCTEWLARHSGSTFNPALQFLKANKIASFSFGLKKGRIQTHLAWPWFLNSQLKGVNEIWLHDIFDENDNPYCPEECAYIKRILGGE